MRNGEEGPIDPTAARYPGRAPIDAYGNGGFRFAGMSHRGSLLCLANAIVGWAPATADRLTRDDFAPVLAEPEGIELLLIGTGRDLLIPSQSLRAELRDAAGIRIEPMDTGAACRTYNVLLAEGRPVGAALIAVD